MLHALHVVGHDLRRDAALGHLVGHLGLRIGLLLGAALAEFATTGRVFLLAHVASGLSLLDFDRLSVNFQGDAEARIDPGFALKGHKAEATWSSRVLVHHECSVDDSTKLGEIVLELGFGCLLTDATNKNLACLLLLITRDSSLRVNLHRRWISLCSGHGLD